MQKHADNETTLTLDKKLVRPTTDFLVIVTLLVTLSNTSICPQEDEFLTNGSLAGVMSLVSRKPSRMMVFAYPSLFRSLEDEKWSLRLEVTWK